MQTLTPNDVGVNSISLPVGQTTCVGSNLTVPEGGAVAAASPFFCRVARGHRLLVDSPRAQKVCFHA